MASNYGLKYTVEVALCIDATGSMGPIINLVKQHALHFYDDVMQKLDEKSKPVEAFRVRLIVFRDYLFDGREAMLATDFFTLPEQKEEFQAMVNSIEPKGGGDDPEDGLEAVGYAIKSKWSKESGGKKRQIIVVWSDDATHPIGYGRQSEFYPQKMAKDFTELMGWWEEMDFHSKRMLIYAPEKGFWTTIAAYWDNAIQFPSEAGTGLDKVTYDEILNAIAGSV